jgi:hypothetical protein
MAAHGGGCHLLFLLSADVENKIKLMYRRTFVKSSSLLNMRMVRLLETRQQQSML